LCWAGPRRGGGGGGGGGVWAPPPPPPPPPPGLEALHMQTAYCMAVVRPHRLLQHLLILHEAAP